MFSLLFTIFDSHWQKQRDVSERNLNQNLTSLNIFECFFYSSQQRHLPIVGRKMENTLRKSYNTIQRGGINWQVNRKWQMSSLHLSLPWHFNWFDLIRFYWNSQSFPFHNKKTNRTTLKQHKYISVSRVRFINRYKFVLVLVLVHPLVKVHEADSRYNTFFFKQKLIGNNKIKILLFKKKGGELEILLKNSLN